MAWQVETRSQPPTSKVVIQHLGFSPTIQLKTNGTRPQAAGDSVVFQAEAKADRSSKDVLKRPVEPARDTTPPMEEKPPKPGHTEVMRWSVSNGLERRTYNNRLDLGPTVSEQLTAWQTAVGWPFGWEIMVMENGHQEQVTTNYFYDMAPQADGGEVVWYGWDGNDFEIYHYNAFRRKVSQLTDNTFDDVLPSIHDGMVVWEAYRSVEADVHLYKVGLPVQWLSSNIEDDINPQTWRHQVVWQGFDGDDFEIYYFDGIKTTKLTSNLFDDINPQINDGLITWMGYAENWDAEIFAWRLGTEDIVQLTTNKYDDREPRTAGGRIVWWADNFDRSMINLAEWPGYEFPVKPYTNRIVSAWAPPEPPPAPVTNAPAPTQASIQQPPNDSIRSSLMGLLILMIIVMVFHLRPGRDKT
ncbi:MAG: hypothetical protein AAF492_05640 [Verrucomicrobiota bacterium]